MAEWVRDLTDAWTVESILFTQSVVKSCSDCNLLGSLTFFDDELAEWSVLVFIVFIRLRYLVLVHVVHFCVRYLVAAVSSEVSDWVWHHAPTFIGWLLIAQCWSIDSLESPWKCSLHMVGTTNLQNALPLLPEGFPWGLPFFGQASTCHPGCPCCFCYGEIFQP